MRFPPGQASKLDCYFKQRTDCYADAMLADLSSQVARQAFLSSHASGVRSSERRLHLGVALLHPRLPSIQPYRAEDFHTPVGVHGISQGCERQRVTPWSDPVGFAQKVADRRDRKSVV